MSEAHEKTRIRQLADAAAHWEHKYANAREYNRKLEARNQKLEAALNTIVSADRSYPDKRVADDMQYCASVALGLTADRGGK